MTKILKINSCNECPKRSISGNHWICGEVEAGNIDSNEIPTWCPLPGPEAKPPDETVRILNSAM